MAGTAMVIDPRLMGNAMHSEDDVGDEEEEQPDNEPSNLGYNPQLGGEATQYDAQLDHERRTQKRKLKSRFEHIFEKYGRDFEGIGDEIDLETGMIVVDNGHLRRMQDENDAGIMDVLNPASAEGADDNARRHHRSASESDEDAEDDDEEYSDAEDNTTVEPENLLEKMPNLRESVLNLQTQQRQGQGIDQDAIQALGLSIAKQLTDLMAQGSKGSAKRKTKDDIWAYPDIPRPPPEKRQRRSLSPLPSWPEATPNSKSLWAPQRIPKRVNRKPPVKEAVEADVSVDASAAPAPDDDTIVLDEDQDSRRCTNCAKNSSVVWRKGPEGILCNACGMYYYRYGLMRPLGPIDESGESESDLSDAEAENDDAQSDYSANTSRRRDEPPPSKTKRFHEDEDILILKLKEIDRLSWEKIAKQMPGRTAYAVQCRYSKKLHKRPTEARAILANEGYEFEHNEHGIIVFTPSPPPKGFSDEEDELLLKMRDEDGLSWDKVAQAFPGRSARAMELRFEQLAKKILAAYHNRGRPPKNKKDKDQPIMRTYLKFTEEEDSLLKRLREVEKLKWTDLAERFPGRNALSLQKRYVRGVSEAAKQRQLRAQGLIERDGVNLRHARYTFEEDELILRLREKDGLSWKEIAEQLPGRLKESVENRYEYIYEKKAHAKVLQELAMSSRLAGNDEQGGDQNGAPRHDDDELLRDSEASLPMLTFVDALQARTIHGEAESRPDKGRSVSRSIHLTPSTQNGGPGLQSLATSATNGHGPAVSAAATKPDRYERQDKYAQFTEAEDVMLRDLRETKHLSFEAIAKRMPGHGAKALQRRYDSIYDESTDTTVSNASVDCRSTSTRFSTAEDKLLRHLREDRRMDFHQIAKHFPGRDPQAIQSHYAAKWGHVTARNRSADAQRAGGDLLRRAIGNNVRRRSSATPPVPTATITIDLTGEPPRGARGLLPSALPQHGHRLHVPQEPTRTISPFVSKLDGPPKVPDVFKEGRGTQQSERPKPSTSKSGETPSKLARAVSTLDGPAKVPDVFRDGSLSILTPVRRRSELYSADDSEPHSPSTTREVTITSESSPSSDHVGSFDFDQHDVDELTTPLPRLPETPSPIEPNSPQYITPSRSNHQSQPYFVAPQAFMFMPSRMDTDHSPESTQLHNEDIQVGAEHGIETGADTVAPLENTKHRLKPVKKRVQPARQFARNATAAVKDIFEILESNQLADQEEETVSGVAHDPKPAFDHDEHVVSTDDFAEAVHAEKEVSSRAADALTKRKRGRPRTRPVEPVISDRPKRPVGRPSNASKLASMQTPAETETSDMSIMEDNTAIAPWPVMLDEDEDELSTPAHSILMSSLRSSSRPRSSPLSNQPTSVFRAAEMMPPPTLPLSDIHREPQSTPASLPSRRILRDRTDIPSSSTKVTPNTTAGILLSSSPILATKRPSGAVYTRTSTPGTGRSTLFGRPEHSRVSALRSSSSSLRSSPMYRSSSVPVPGSRKRIVHTPLRDGDDSGDELA